jgi:hypothetical protein
MARVPRFAPGEVVKYVPDHKSFGAWIMSEEMRSMVEPIAIEIALQATATAPEPSEDTRPEAAMKAVYTVDREGGSKVVGGNARVVVKVTGDGEPAERAEFSYNEDGTRRYNLRRAAADFGSWKPID